MFYKTPSKCTATKSLWQFNPGDSKTNDMCKTGVESLGLLLDLDELVFELPGQDFQYDGWYQCTSQNVEGCFPVVHFGDVAKWKTSKYTSN